MKRTRGNLLHGCVLALHGSRSKASLGLDRARRSKQDRRKRACTQHASLTARMQLLLVCKKKARAANQQRSFFQSDLPHMAVTVLEVVRKNIQDLCTGVLAV